MKPFMFLPLCDAAVDLAVQSDIRCPQNVRRALARISHEGDRETAEKP